MMKRTLLALLLLLPALTSGCEKAPQTDNGNGNRPLANTSLNANGANANVNANTSDSLTPLIPFSKEDKSVAVVVYADGGGALKVLVAPDPIKLSKGKGQKLRFHVFNDTDVDFSKVDFVFAENPFDGTFTITDIKAGDDEGDATKRIKAAAPEKKYKYTIKVYGTANPTTPIAELDPEVEIAT